MQRKETIVKVSKPDSASLKGNPAGKRRGGKPKKGGRRAIKKSKSDWSGKDKSWVDREKTLAVNHNKAVASQNAILTNIKNNVHSGDIRVTKCLISPSNSVDSEGTNSYLPINVPLNPNALFGFAAGVVSYALGRGWQQSISNKSWPFCALIFIANVILSAWTKTNPLVNQVPYWLACICQAGAPCKIDYNNNHFEYKWLTDLTPGQMVNLQSEVPYGPPGASTKILYGIVDNVNTVNTNYYQINPATYDPIQGQLAFTSLQQYLADNCVKELKYMHKSVPFSASNKFSNDCSAFAGFTSNPGGSIFNSGAMGSRVGSETPIKTPLFSHFTTLVTNYSTLNRCPKHSTFTGGGAMNTAMIVSALTDRNIRQVRQPQFKYLDALQFMDVYCQVIQKMIQLYVDDRTNMFYDDSTTAAQIKERLDAIRPALTLQQLQIALREEIMSVMSETQCFVQAIYPETQSGNSAFCPYSVGVGTCPVSGGIALNWPLFLAENLKCFTGRYEDMKVDGPEGKRTELRMVMPVVGQFLNNFLVDTDYSIKITQLVDGVSTDTLYPVFLPVTSNLKKKVVPGSPSPFKKEAENVGVVQTAISLIDGSCSGGFVCLNDPNFLEYIKNEMNSKITVLSAYGQRFGPVGRDGGVTGLTVLDKTRYVYNGSDYAGKKGAPKFFGQGDKIIAQGYAQEPFSTLENTFTMILPVIKINDEADAGSNILKNYSSLYDETTIKAIAYSSGGMTTLDLQERISNACVGARESGDNIITSTLMQAGRNGQGGIIADIFGTLAPVGAQAIHTGLTLAGL